MLKILAPIDGSSNARRVVDYLIQTAANLQDVQITLVNVREPVNAPEVGRFWKADQILDFQQKEGDLLLQPARDRLEAGGIRTSAEVLIGEIAPAIAEYAKKHDFNMIVMGTRGMSAIANLLMGSVATKVVHLSDVPVALVK